MSFFGRLSDLISGQPAGTADGIAAIDASVNAQEQAINAQRLASGQWDQAQYDQAQADYAAQPGSTAADQAFQTTAAAALGAVDAAGHPVQVLDTGLTWEGQVAGNAVSSVTTAATGAAGNVLGKFLSAIPIWLWLAAAAGLFLYLGGGGFLERKARGRLSR